MKKYIIAYCKLIIFFYAALVLVFLIPESGFRSDIKQVNQYIEAVNGAEPKVMNNEIAVLTIHTDVHMYQAMERSEYNVWKAVLDINGYARYWHGYLVVLRPLAFFFEYDEVRFILGTITLILFSIVMIRVSERVGLHVAVTQGAALALTFFAASTLCLTYVCCYIILFIGELILLKKYHIENINYVFYLLFVLGMITNYFDFLTYPLIIPGGILLLVIYIHYLEDIDNTLQKEINILIRGTIVWGIGYALTWGTKWLMASVILKENIVLDALEQATYRSYGGNKQSIFSSAFLAVRKNLGSLLMDRIGIILAVILICSLTVFLFWVYRFKKSGKLLFPIVLIAIYPYVWYAILAQHSIQHSYLTYKAQMITIWAILLLGMESIYQIAIIQKMNKRIKKE